MKRMVGHTNIKTIKQILEETRLGSDREATLAGERLYKQKRCTTSGWPMSENKSSSSTSTIDFDIKKTSDKVTVYLHLTKHARHGSTSHYLTDTIEQGHTPKH